MIRYVYTFESDLLSYSKEMYCKCKCVNRDVIVARGRRDEDRSELRRSSSDAAYHGNPLLEFFAFPCRSDGGNAVTGTQCSRWCARPVPYQTGWSHHAETT